MDRKVSSTDGLIEMPEFRKRSFTLQIIDGFYFECHITSLASSFLTTSAVA